MGLTKSAIDVDNISSLSTTPNVTEGLTAAELQARFDKSASDNKSYINNTLTTEIDAELADIESAVSDNTSDISDNTTELEGLNKIYNTLAEIGLNDTTDMSATDLSANLDTIMQACDGCMLNLWVSTSIAPNLSASLMTDALVTENSGTLEFGGSPTGLYNTGVTNKFFYSENNQNNLLYGTWDNSWQGFRTILS